MKRVILSVTILLFTFSLSAQTFLGAGMENWRQLSVGFPSTNVDLPNNWFGTDSLIFTVAPFLSIPTSGLSKQMVKSSDAHSGAFAAEITSKNQGSTLGVIPGILTNARPGIDIANFDPNNPIGSINYTGGTSIGSRYGYVSAWIKYTPQGADKAQIIVTAVMSGKGAGGADSVVGSADTIISGQISSYTKYELEIKYIDPNVVPDKLLVVFLSSTNATSTSPVDGSTLKVDDAAAGIHPAGIRIALFENNVVTCFPNPASGLIHIRTSQKGELVWKLYGVNGQEVKNVKFVNSIAVKVGSIPSGLYFYSVNDAEGYLLQSGKLSINN